MMDTVKPSLPSKLGFQYRPGFVDTILHTNALIFWSRRNLGSDGITRGSENADIGESSLLID